MNKTDNKSSVTPSVNGQIELLRFLFCMSVLFFHAEKYLLGEPDRLGSFTPYFFVHGAIGVEFFFVCSGFFMARSLKKDLARDPGRDIGDASVSFFLHKVRSIAPVHVVFFILAFISLVISRGMELKMILKSAVESVPAFLLIQMLGFKGFSPNHFSWYLSVMLFSMFVIYPFARKFYSVFVKVIAPSAGLFILGFLFLKYGSLTGVMVKTGIFYKSMLRGFAEILIGMAAYEIAEWAAHKDPARKVRIIITIANFATLILLGIYIMHTLSAKYEFFAVPASVFLLITAYSRLGVLNRFADNKVCVYLGKLSLPVYMAQNTALNIISIYKEDLSFVLNTVLFAVCVFAMAWAFSTLTKRS